MRHPGYVNPIIAQLIALDNDMPCCEREDDDYCEDCEDFAPVHTGDHPALPADVREHDGDYFITVEVAGVKKEDISISFDNNALTVEVVKKPVEVEDEIVHSAERAFGTFGRKFEFSDTIDVEKITAGVEDGVLSIHLPVIPEKETAVKIAIN